MVAGRTYYEWAAGVAAVVWGADAVPGTAVRSQLAQDELEDSGIDCDQLRGVGGGLTRDKQGAH